MMGKRFKELAEQAGLYDFVFEVMGVDEELTNFAESIVRECATVAGRDVAHFVLKHFELEN
jgi:hypothetical protein